jgi:conjugal transfer/entry exclusion protein
MKPRYAVKLILVLSVVAVLTTRAHAFLGIGDVVFDPSNYAEAVQQVVRLEQQYAQLVQTYVMVRNQYEHLLWMAQQVPVTMAARYRVIASPWSLATAANTYGTTASWIRSVNTGRNVTAGYAASTEPLNNYGAALAGVPADQVERVKISYGTVELADGATRGAMTTIGQLRVNAAAVESTIQRLEQDSLSSDPRMNTEIAVLNKINAAHVIALRAGQNTNQLLVTLTEQQAIDAKRQRDAEARAINEHIRFMAEGRAVMNAQASGASQAILDWRMP